MAKFLGMKILNWIFIILTIVKAYYITWDFMHMRDEKASLRRNPKLSNASRSHSKDASRKRGCVHCSAL